MGLLGLLVQHWSSTRGVLGLPPLLRRPGCGRSDGHDRAGVAGEPDVWLWVLLSGSVLCTSAVVALDHGDSVLGVVSDACGV